MDNNNLITGAGLVGMALSGLLQNGSPQQDTLSAASQSATINQVAAEISAESLAASAQLAETRFNSNLCVRSTVPLVEGMGVSKTLRGQIICDSQGKTAEVAPNGSLTMFAQTGNQALIMEGLR